VDNPTMLEIIKEHLIPIQSGWILDGYPRLEEQAIEFDKLLKSAGQSISTVLYIDVPDDVIVSRITNRLIHPGSGRIYHRTYNPPKTPMIDDETGEPLIQRTDDNEETVKGRLDSYHKLTRPLLKYYTDRDLLATIPSPNSDEGYEKIKKYWPSLLKKVAQKI